MRSLEGSTFVRVLPGLLGAVVAGFLVRVAGALEGTFPSGGFIPIGASAALSAILCIALWSSSRSIRSPVRFLFPFVVPLLMAVAAGPIWAAYAVLPGTALALMLIAVRAALR